MSPVRNLPGVRRGAATADPWSHLRSHGPGTSRSGARFRGGFWVGRRKTIPCISSCGRASIAEQPKVLPRGNALGAPTLGGGVHGCFGLQQGTFLPRGKASTPQPLSELLIEHVQCLRKTCVGVPIRIVKVLGEHALLLLAGVHVCLEIVD